LRPVELYPAQRPHQPRDDARAAGRHGAASPAPLTGCGPGPPRPPTAAAAELWCQRRDRAVHGQISTWTPDLSGPRPGTSGPLLHRETQAAGDEHALELRGALADLQHLGVPVEARDRAVLHDAVPAEDLRRDARGRDGGLRRV